MREVIFIKKNKPRWDELEQFISGKTNLSPDDIADHYIAITDDLAYSNTFFPTSELAIYLNGLALKSHQLLYKSKPEKKSRFKTFFTQEVPEAILNSHKELGYSLIIFLIAIGVGLFSSMKDANFPNLILGDQYVNMTIHNIERGDPMGVYGDSGSTPMFFGISSNNIRVSFLAYVIGIFSSLPVGFILLSNGIMVGAFMSFFINRGLGWLSFSSIMIHGTLELSAIVIAAGAGLVLGNSFLFPKTYSRNLSLRRAGKRSLKIIIGLIPVFLIAGFLESYVTRHYLLLGSVGRIFIMLSSLLFVLWYFFLYPLKLEQNGIIRRI